MNNDLEQPRKKEPAKPGILPGTKVIIGNLDPHFTPAWFKQDFPRPNFAEAIKNRRPNVSGFVHRHIAGLWWLVALENDDIWTLYNEKEFTVRN